MKLSTGKFVPAIAAVLLVLPPGSPQERPEVKGTFIVYAADKRIETDRYEIIPGSRVVDEITIEATGGERKIETRIVNGSSVSYTQTLNGKPEYSAVLENGVITFREGEAEAMVGALPVEGRVTMFEPTAFAEMALVFDRYDAGRDGKQVVESVIPSLQDLIRVEVERHGTDAVTAGGSPAELVHHRVAIGKREVINVWSRHGRVAGMYFASKGMYVIDGENPQMREQIRKLVNKAM